MKKYPFFVGVQFHPKFKSRSRTSRPHPLLRRFVQAALEK